MSKSNGALNAIGKVITYILIVLLVLGIAGSVAYFFMRSQGMTFYVEYNGEHYLIGSDGDSFTLRTGETHEFFVKSLTGGEVDFDVKIMSNADNNIAFACNEEYHNTYTANADTNDYSDVFGLQTKTDGFTVTIPQDMTVETAIETKYGGDITLLDELSYSTAYFIISVTVDESSVNLPFIFGEKVSGITLNPPQIVF